MPSTSSYTRSQLLAVARAWGVDVVPPSKGRVTTVVFPAGPQYDFGRAEIKVADQKSTGRMTLFTVEFFDPRTSAVLADVLSEIAS